MSYIRKHDEERTGYQTSLPFGGLTDFQNDFVMAYRLNDTTVQRVAGFKAAGYSVHLMTGISWGSYVDYLDGEFDGENHWDEAQTDRFNNRIMHGEKTPYMVPTVAFADYLSQKLKVAVDAGVEAIHVEEPEFWDRAGYSEAFKREYVTYYHEPWRPAYSDIDARYKTAKLKAYLYKRTIERVAASLKEYALKKYGRELRFYVPTHSLLNYTQWKIVSPEGALCESPVVDGFIAQVWTGTSRTPNVYNGVFRERTLETSYLEYGVMQELVAGTGKRMWFLHDPIEDNPAYTWENYRYNYLQTVTASLLHTGINRYEICPWPNRVFSGRYPSDSPDATTIPPDYASLLCGVFQTLGDMESVEPCFQHNVGVLISDSALFQRDYPDSLLGSDAVNETGTVLQDSPERFMALADALFTDSPKDGGNNSAFFREFVKSGALPSFYGMAMPLLKRGLPVRPVLLENVRRYTGYLDNYDTLVLSYEYIKPEYPDVNTALAGWVRNGGMLLLVCDGSDPYNNISAWWNNGIDKYDSPTDHLFSQLGISPKGREGIYAVGNGFVAFLKESPARLCCSDSKAGEYYSLFEKLISKKGMSHKACNYLQALRGAYRIACVFDESVNDEPLIMHGLFSDMFTTDYAIITSKCVAPDGGTLLFDYSLIENEKLCVIGCQTRVMSLVEKGDGVTVITQGAAGIHANMRIRVPYAVSCAIGQLENGEAIEISCDYDAQTRTVLLGFESDGKTVEITVKQ